MLTVYFLKGLPASGKSTWAKEQVRLRPGAYKIISKDWLRNLDDKQHTGSMEGFVIKARNALIKLALDDGKHVIVDDTNLNSVHERSVRALVAEYKGRVRFEVVDFTHVGPEECERRDLLRCPSVGHDVIWDMYNKYLRKAPELQVVNPTLPFCILVDVDGTLAWKGDRDIYDASKCYLDALNPAVAAVVRNMSPHVVVFVMSGRQEVHREPTKDWLLANGVRYDAMYMRATRDQRQDAIVKEELYHEHIEGKYNVLFVLDDRQQVVDMWRRLGLQCFQVQEGSY